MTSYAAGIDLGTTFAGAAVFSGGTTQLVQLEAATPVSPSVLVPTATGSWLVGEEAVLSAGPAARRFKRLVGSHPIVVGGQEWEPQVLLSVQLRWVMGRISAQQGLDPSAVVLTHPSNWGPHRLAKLQEAAKLAGLPEVSVLAEPVAAAVFHASRSVVETGHIVAVYDLGGGTTDVSIMRKAPNRFELVATSGTDSGSVDFDDALLDLIEERLGYPAELDPSSLVDVIAEAKIRLSTDPAVRITIPMGGDRAQVDVTVEDLTAVVTPLARQGVVHLENALRQAGLEADDVDTVLLAGGGGGMPLVQRLVAETAGRDPVVSNHPKLAVAYGAAISAGATASLLEPVQPTRPAPDFPPPGPTAPALDFPPPGDPGQTQPIPVDTTGLEAGPSVIVFDVPTGPAVRRPLATIVQQAGPLRSEADEQPDPVTFGTSRLRELVFLVVVVALVITAAVVLSSR